MSQYRKEERWQLPGLTGKEALQLGEWHSFCTKVEETNSQGEILSSRMVVKHVMLDLSSCLMCGVCGLYGWAHADCMDHAAELGLSCC